MGFDTQICKLAITATDSLLKEGNSPVRAPYESPSNQTVVFDDALTRIYNDKGPRGAGLLSGLELFRSVFGPVTKELNENGVDVYHMTIDNRLGVPKEKGETQLLRVKAAEKQGVVPYPDGCIFSDGGLVIDGNTELIDLRRLQATRALRMPMCLYLNECVRNLALIPEGKAFYFDYEHSDGPWRYDANGAVQVKDSIWTQHKLGETDLRAPQIYEHYAGWNVRSVSPDSDFMAIALIYLHKAPIEKWPETLVWEHREYKKSNIIKVDMLKMYGQFQLKMQMTIEQFVLACILSGSDYNLKKPVAHWFNHEAIINAVRTLNPDMSYDQITMSDLVHFNRQLFTSKINTKCLSAPLSPKNKKKRKRDEIKTKRSVVSVAYEEEANGLFTKKQIVSIMNNHNGFSRHVIPTSGEFGDRLRLINFNLDYWMNSWQQPLSIASDVADTQPPL